MAILLGIAKVFQILDNRPYIFLTNLSIEKTNEALDEGQKSKVFFLKIAIDNAVTPVITARFRLSLKLWLIGLQIYRASVETRHDTFHNCAYVTHFQIAWQR